MGEWRRVRIGDVCDIVKGETGLASGTPGQYPMVATGAERRSCNTYQFDTEAVCIPLVSSTGHGKKTLNYVHFQSGKFALGTILAAVIPKDPKVLTARYLHLYLSHFKDSVLVPLMKGAANVSLPMKGIASVEIPVPSVGQQQKLIDLIGRIESEHRELLEEGTHQAGLFKKLRQALLQEAVEGKLTADWRKQNPVVKGDPQQDASALLVQIKTEKEGLVKAGKSRAEKLLLPIIDSDMLFDLPVEWAWCRFGEIVNLDTGKLDSNAAVPGGKFPFFTCSKDPLEIDRFSFDCEAVLLAGNNAAGNFNVKHYKGKFDAYQRTYVITANQFLDGFLDYGFLRIILEFSLDVLKEKSIGSLTQYLTLGILKPLPFPLPPLTEQQAIVARVDSLMATIDALEAQVTERKEQAQQLMQAVLREAFAGNDKVSS